MAPKWLDVVHVVRINLTGYFLELTSRLSLALLLATAVSLFRSNRLDRLLFLLDLNLIVFEFLVEAIKVIVEQERMIARFLQLRQ